MTTAAVRGNGGRSERLYFYYRCHSRHNEGSSACSQAKSYRAEEVEAQVWEAISRVFGDPETLRADLERMIELEREGMRGDPEREAKVWCDKLAEADRKRSGFQDMAADGLIAFDELRAKLAALEETRAMAERELEGLRHRREHLDSLERNKESVLENYAALAPKALHSLTPEERHRLYKMLKLRVNIDLDGALEVGGALVDDLAVCQVGASS
jgi:hypothetical protein